MNLLFLMFFHYEIYQNTSINESILKAQTPIYEYQEGIFTAYNPDIFQCGKTDGITASGEKAKENHTLACPPEYKFGTKIEIKDLGIYECEDRGGAIKENHFDIFWGKDSNGAIKFGKKELLFRVL